MHRRERVTVHIRVIAQHPRSPYAQRGPLLTIVRIIMRYGGIVYRSYLLAGAEKVALPEGFWDEPLVVRQALFFREVLREHLPVQVLDGELIVGSHFSTALSRCLNRSEARVRDRQEESFLKEWQPQRRISSRL